MLNLFNNCLHSDDDSASKPTQMNGNVTNGSTVVDSETVYRKYYRNYRLSQLTDKCPAFIQSCRMCMCLHRKVEPGDPNGNGSKSSNLNGTPIIPIMVGPDA